MGLVLRLATLFSSSGGREKGNSGHFDLETYDLKGGIDSRKKREKGACLLVLACLVLEKKERVLPRMSERKRKGLSFV